MITVTRTDAGRTYSMGENTAEAARQAGIAKAAAATAAADTVAAASVVLDGKVSAAQTAQTGAQAFMVRSGNAVPFATWTALAAATGMVSGDRARVRASDTGTHTDPATSATVNNAGDFTYQTSPAGWTRTADLDSQTAKAQADTATTKAAEAAASASGLSGVLYGSIAKLFTRQGFYNNAGAYNGSDASYACTDYIETAFLDIASLKLAGHTAIASVAFYDANKTFISGSVAASNGAFVTSYPAVPGSAVYVTFTDTVAQRANEIFVAVPKFAKLNPTSIPANIATDQQATITAMFSRPGYITTTGGYTADATWGTTPLIEVAQVTMGRLKLYGHTVVSTVAFWTKDGAFISGVTAGSVGAYITGTGTIPGNAFYMTFTHKVSDLANEVFVPIARPSAQRRSDQVEPVDMTAFGTTPGYVTASGALTVDANWLTTDYFAVIVGATIQVDVWGHSAIKSVAFYDANRAFLSGSGAASANSEYKATVTVPAGAVSARFSYANPAGSGTGYPGGFVNLVSYKAPLPGFLGERMKAAAKVASPAFAIPVFKRPRAMKLTSGNKIVAYGDSRSSTDYAFVATNLAALTGATAEAGGISGSTTAQQVSDANLAALFARNPDAAIWTPGGNDTGQTGTVGTFYGAIDGEDIAPEISIAGSYTGTKFIQAIDYGIRRFLAQYYNIRTRAGLTGAESETVKNNMIRAVSKPMLVLCTDLPQQRNNSSDPYSLPANWQRKRQAIIEACWKNKVHCVDTMNAIAWDMSLEPFYVGPTAIVNNGVWTMDGLHPNEFGKMQVDQIVCADAGLA